VNNKALKISPSLIIGFDINPAYQYIDLTDWSALPSFVGNVLVDFFYECYGYKIADDFRMGFLFM